MTNRIKVIKCMAYGYRDSAYFFPKIKAAQPFPVRCCELRKRPAISDPYENLSLVASAKRNIHSDRPRSPTYC